MDEMLGLGGRYLVYRKYVLLLSVQDQCEVIRCISDFSITLYLVGPRVKRTKIWTPGIVNVHRVLVTAKGSRLF